MPRPAPSLPAGGRPAGWVRRLAAACWRHRWLTVLALLSSAVGVGLEALAPLLTKVAVDDAVAGSPGRLGLLVAGLVGIGVLRFGAAFVRRYLGGRLALDVQHDLRRAVFAAVQRLDGAKQDALRTGQVVSRAITDLQLVQGLLAMVPLATGTVVLFVVALGAMLWLSPLLTVIALVVVPAVALVTDRTRRRLFPATWSAQQRAADVAQHVEEAVTGVRVVKGFGQESRAVAGLERTAQRLFAERLRSARLASVYTPTLSAFPSLGQLAVFALGGWLALRGQISLGTFVAFASYIALLVGPARLLASLVVNAQLARAGVERVYELVDSQPEVTDTPDAVDLPDGPLAVQLDGVRFGYSRSDPVLDGVTLDVRPGETLALVGTQGSGKSTVSLLLARFYDVHGGAVRVGGHDVRELRLASLRGAIGMVFEEAFLFSDTLRANIAYGRPEASDAEVRAAAEAAQVAEFVATLPHGYDTVVGERGLTLSGGQRQRVALARALLSEPRVLVLDDATSAVDPATEAAIHAALTARSGEQVSESMARPCEQVSESMARPCEQVSESMARPCEQVSVPRPVSTQRTTLLVAHRRSTLALADRIAVLDAGRLVDVGSRAELEARCPLFRALLIGSGEAIDAAVEDAGPAGRGALWAAPEEITPALWPDPPEAGPAPARRGSSPARPGIEGGPRGGGARTARPSAVANEMPATPELLAAVRALPAATAQLRLGEVDPRAPDPGFRLTRLLRPVRGALLAVIALVTLDAAAGVAFPALGGLAVGGITGADASLLWLAVGLGLVVVVADWLVVAAQTRATARAGESVLYLLRVRSFAHLQRLGLDFYERELAGRVMTRMTTDVDALSTFLQTGLATAVVSLLTIAGVAIALLVTDPGLALVAMAGLPVLVAATTVFRRRSSVAYTEARERVSEVNADLQENVSGVRVAQAFTRERHSARAFARRSDAYRRTRLRAQRYIATYFPFVALLSDLAQAAVLGVGAAQVAAGSVSPAVLTAFLLYLAMFFTPVQQLAQVSDAYQQAKVGLRRIGALLRTPTSLPAPAVPVRVPDRLLGEVELRGVGFTYQGVDRPALDGVSLRVDPGETVALVGATGAGKSTLVKLLARFYDPARGAVLVDGVDLRRYDLAGYRQRLGVVPQEAHLFTGDVASNIGYGRPDATPAEIEAAARRIGALDALAALPHGFRQTVGERGQGLSAGQRQLVALARAELVDPDLLLLDEATAALDPATEAAVLAAADRLAAHRTTVVIAHRLTTAARADRIVVLDGGRIVEQGGHAELLAVGGHYARLWAAGSPDGSAAA